MKYVSCFLPLLQYHSTEIVIAKKKKTGQVYTDIQVYLFRFTYLNVILLAADFVQHYATVKEWQNLEFCKLEVRGSVHHSTIHTTKNSTRCNSVSKFIIPYLYEAQHVSGDTPPIIRSLKLH